MIRTKTKRAIEQHALSEWPRECCGLIVGGPDGEEYFPCVNLSVNPHQFLIGPADMVAAEDRGPILFVLHSHTDCGPQPSEADRVECERSGVPWIIIAVHQSEVLGWSSLEPDGYRAPLVGRAFHHGTLDCYGLIKDFYARELAIQLPEADRPDKWWDDPAGTELYLENFERAGFRVVDGTPQYGDVVLMRYHSPRTNHGGVFLGDRLISERPDLPPVVNAMLHHSLGRLSDRVVYGGYWRDITTCIVRHSDVG